MYATRHQRHIPATLPDTTKTILDPIITSLTPAEQFQWFLYHLRQRSWKYDNTSPTISNKLMMYCLTHAAQSDHKAAHIILADITCTPVNHDTSVYKQNKKDADTVSQVYRIGHPCLPKDRAIHYAMQSYEVGNIVAVHTLTPYIRKKINKDSSRYHKKLLHRLYTHASHNNDPFSSIMMLILHEQGMLGQDITEEEYIYHAYNIPSKIRTTIQNQRLRTFQQRTPAEYTRIVSTVTPTINKTRPTAEFTTIEEYTDYLDDTIRSIDVYNACTQRFRHMHKQLLHLIHTHTGSTPHWAQSRLDMHNAMHAPH